MRRTKPPFPVLNRGHRLAQGLVASWMFYEGSGRTVHDVSGNSHHGTWNGSGGGSNTTPGWVAGRDGWAMEFDGTDDYLQTSFDPKSTIGDGKAWSVSLGVKMKSVTNNGRLFGNDFGLTNLSRWYVATSSTPVYFWGYGNLFRTATNATISVGQWQHLVVAFDGNRIRTFLDNKLVDNFDYTGLNNGNGMLSANPLYIGDFPSQSIPTNATMKDILIYNRALSADEIAELYHDPYGMFRHNRVLISVGSKPWLYRPKTLMLGGV